MDELLLILAVSTIVVASCWWMITTELPRLLADLGRLVRWSWRKLG